MACFLKTQSKMPKKITTPQMIADIKTMLERNSIKETAKHFPVSYYTVWNVAKGNYEKAKPYARKKELWDRCPITGLK